MVHVFNFNNVVKVEGLATQRSRASTFAYPVLIELGLLVVVAFLNTAKDAGRVVPGFVGAVAAGLAQFRAPWGQALRASISGDVFCD